MRIRVAADLVTAFYISEKPGNFSFLNGHYSFIEFNMQARFRGNRRQPVMTGLKRCTRRPFVVVLRCDNGVLTNNKPCQAPEN